MSLEGGFAPEPSAMSACDLVDHDANVVSGGVSGHDGLSGSAGYLRASSG